MLKRYVSNNVLVSPALPFVKIKVDEAFRYIGRFEFEILALSDEWPESLRGQAIAQGERFVFAQADA